MRMPFMLLGLLGLLTAAGRAQEPAGTAGIQDKVHTLVDSLRTIHCPDRRESVYDITFTIDSSKVILEGEVMERGARDALIAGARETAGLPVDDRIRVLPDSTARETPFGVIRISVAQVRAEPSNASEMVSQNVMGARVRVLKAGDNTFYYVQMEDKYLGWIKRSAMAMGDQAFMDAWNQAQQAVVTALWCRAFEKKDETADPVTDLVQGCRILLVKQEKNWSHIRLPDGREGYVRTRHILPVEKQPEVFPLRAASLIAMGKAVLGVPYLWGGSSVKGFDCSGFVQHLFRMHGVQLPRDASLQVRSGTEVPLTQDLNGIRPGDLLFFGSNPKRITHVGMAMEDGRFIHASELVRINSLNPDHEEYSEYLHERLRAVRRLMGE